MSARGGRMAPPRASVDAHRFHRSPGRRRDSPIHAHVGQRLPRLQPPSSLPVDPPMLLHRRFPAGAVAATLAVLAATGSLAAQPRPTAAAEQSAAISGVRYDVTFDQTTALTR